MEEAYKAAIAYQNSPRAYDDKHPAELVEAPLAKAKLYAREVLLRRRSFLAVLAEAQEVVALLRTQREALGEKPSLDAQKEAYETNEKLQYHYTAGVTMLGLDYDEAVHDARRGFEALALDSSAAQARRIARFDAQENYIEVEGEKFRREVEAEFAALKAAMPDFDAIAPKLVAVSEAAW